MDNLTNKWKEAREAMAHSTQTAEQLIARAKEKKKSILYFHYGNILILTITLVTISLFFYYVAPFKDLLSRIGVSFMVGGLLLRIIIEAFSTNKSKNIHLVDNALTTTNAALLFYNFRKKVHGPVTISIVALYIIGFYFLSPEFSKYISVKWMVLMHISFLAGAIFLTWQIRKGIQQEMRNLSSLAELKNEMNKA